jgi:hypothetical protein
MATALNQLQNLRICFWDDFQWHNHPTEFYKNWSIYLKIATGNAHQINKEMAGHVECMADEKFIQFWL